MVQVPVGDDHPEQRRVGGIEAPDRVERDVFGLGIERQADIEDDALALRLELDATAADLARAPVDADAHCITSGR